MSKPSYEELAARLEAKEREAEALKAAVKAAAANGFSFKITERKDPKTKEPIPGDLLCELKVANFRPERHKPGWWRAHIEAIVEHHKAMLQTVDKAAAEDKAA